MESLSQLFETGGGLDTIPTAQMFWAAILTFALCSLVGYVYRVTHEGPSYSQTTVQTMVIMGIVVSFIMMIIGTNIARAFSLVGALSIIRFRNAVKESRDVAFYFLSMGIGMACGTGFFGNAIVFTVTVCSIIYVMQRLNVGSKQGTETLLRVTLDESVDFKTAFDETFFSHLDNSDLVSVDSDGTGTLELMYNVTLRRGKSEQGLICDLAKVDPSIQSQVIFGQCGISL